MALVSELDLPAFDYTTPDFPLLAVSENEAAEAGEGGHRLSAAERVQFVVNLLAGGIDKLPVIWPGSAGPSRNDGPGPDG